LPAFRFFQLLLQALDFSLISLDLLPEFEGRGVAGPHLGERPVTLDVLLLQVGSVEPPRFLEASSSLRRRAISASVPVL